MWYVNTKKSANSIGKLLGFILTMWYVNKSAFLSFINLLNVLY